MVSRNLLFLYVLAMVTSEDPQKPFQGTLAAAKHVVCLLNCELEELGNHLEHVSIHTCNLECAAVNHCRNNQTQTQTHTDPGAKSDIFTMTPPPPRPAPAPYLHLTHPLFNPVSPTTHSFNASVARGDTITAVDH